MESARSVSTHKQHMTMTGLGMLFLIVLTGISVTGCTPPVYHVESRPVTPPPQPRLYFYPTQGQTQAQQDRDRYDCHVWAVRKSGFDPGLTPLAPHQRVDVVSQPAPGSNVAAGAVGGAVIGSILSGPRRTGRGVAIGAFAGALLGAISEAEQQQQTQRLQQQYDANYARKYAQAEQKAQSYQRAMTACLEGRGYSVR